MTRPETTSEYSTVLGCAALVAMFSLLLAVPFALFGWFFGNETALRLGVGFFLWPIVTLLGWKLLVWVMGMIVWIWKG